MLALASLILALGGARMSPAIAQDTLRARDQQPRTGAERVTLRVLVTRDSVGGEPLADALVRIGAAGARTGADGLASLRVIPGTHMLYMSRIGFQPDSTAVTLAPGEDVRVAHALRERVAAIEGVVVSATRGERRVEDTPVRVEIVDEEEVAEKTAMRPGSIAMLLAETGGLRVQTTSPSLGGAAVRVQGLRGRYTLLLADGLPLHGGQTGGLGLLQIPPVDLGRVEIIKGSASALYGSSALGGVINLVSRRPGESAERELLLNQTTREGTDGVLYLSAPLSGRWGYSLLAGGHRQERQDVDGDGWTDMPGYRRGVLRPRLFFDGGAGRSAFITGGFTAEDRRGGTLGGSAPDGAPYDERLWTRRADVGAVARMLIADGALAGALVSARASAVEQRHAHTFGTVREHDRHRTSFAEASLAVPRGRVTPLIGIAMQHDAYRAADVQGFDYTYVIPSLFAQADVDVTTRVTASVNARLDAHDEYGTIVNPRLSLLLKGPAEGRFAAWAARISAGTGAHAPTPFTEDTEVTGLVPLQALAGLRAERARSGAVDVGGPVETAAGQLELNATLFGSVVDDALQVRDVAGVTAAGASRIALANAAGATRTGGAELLARLSREPFRLTATYTHLRASEPDPDGDARMLARREVPLNPRHAAGLVASIEREGESRLGLEVYYTGRQALEHSLIRTTSRPYLVLGVLGERRYGAVRLFVNAENLTGVRQTRDEPLVLRRRGSGGRWTTDVWGPLEGFVLNAGARVRL